MNNLLKKQSGQILPFFIVAGTILLAVIANLSLRNISSGFRSTTMDTASRVTAAAEGGLERFLSYSYGELANKSAPGACSPANANLGDDCKVTFAPSIPDNISAQAIVTVEAFGTTRDFGFRAKKDQVFEVNLDSTDFDKNKLYLCWSGDADIYYIAYGSGATPLTRVYVCSASGCKNTVAGAYLTSTASVNKCPGSSYNNQVKIRDLTSVTALKGLRVRTVGASVDVDVMVHSDAGVLPIQGYEITSKGQILDSGDVQATEVKVVRISFPFLPAYFDFGLFSEGGY